MTKIITTAKLEPTNIPPANAAAILAEISKIRKEWTHLPEQDQCRLKKLEEYAHELFNTSLNKVASKGEESDQHDKTDVYYLVFHRKAGPRKWVAKISFVDRKTGEPKQIGMLTPERGEALWKTLDALYERPRKDAERSDEANDANSLFGQYGQYKGYSGYSGYGGAERSGKYFDAGDLRGRQYHGN